MTGNKIFNCLKFAVMYKFCFIICFFLEIPNSVKSQSLSIDDSSKITKSIIELDSSKLKFDTKVNSIPKYIIKAIRETKKGFKITDNAKKYSNDIHIGRKKNNRLLKYIIFGKDFFILTYKFGGFVSNTRLFYFTIVDRKVYKIFNFTIPEHDSFSSLLHILQVPDIKLKNFDSYYW